MAWLLDTNVIAELASDRPSAAVVAWADGQDERAMFLSVLTLAEFDKGIANLAPDHPARARIEAEVRALELRFGQRVLPVSAAVVRRWGRMAGEVKRVQGRALPVIDGLLAATAVEHDLTLVTRNVRDVLGTGAMIRNPWVVAPG